MPDFSILYDETVLEHLAEHGVTIEEFKLVVDAPLDVDQSRSTGRCVAFGFAPDGRFLACVYEQIDELTVLPITAYEVEP